MNVRIGIGLLLCFVAAVEVGGQISLPARHDGFLYKKKEVGMDSIVIEAFVDPVCPDSRDAWPPLKQAVNHYGLHLVSLIVHPFPLPYHDNAFVTSRALHIVNNINHNATFDLLDRFFQHQEQFYNKETRNISRASVTSKVAMFTTRSLRKTHLSDIESAFNDRATDLKTRTSFKYGCSRGVFGTPTFFVNGFALPDAASPLDYHGWRNTIDPLISMHHVKSTQLGEDKTLRYF